MVLPLISSETDVRLETVSVLILRLRLIKLEIRAVLATKYPEAVSEDVFMVDPAVMVDNVSWLALMVDPVRIGIDAPLVNVPVVAFNKVV